ncbi:glutamate-gated chloride channel-like [Pollicipes pollicipes]|uniref:glutamate-gated chloride channel-like n=1 Tax=Pollicipes pollicipes TaxID=41117 RepID=UPI001884E91C|nr:glutamate-gated chloride channel-like [Pollicipes pollicipes]
MPTRAQLLGATLVTALLCGSGPVAANNDINIFNMMVKNYKPEEAPDRYGPRGAYIPVQAQAMLEAIEVDEHGSAVTLRCLWRLTWTDMRLRYRGSPAAGGLMISHATAGLMDAPKIWLPSVLYPRSLSVDFDNSLDNMFMIRPNGTITWQRRVITKAPCGLNVAYFPWDKNTCRVFLRQNLDSKALMLNWTRSGVRPVYAGPNLSISGFRLTSLGASSRIGSMAEDHGGPARSKSLVLRVTFRRVSIYYIINDIIPTCILVIASYMTFWLSPGSVVVRALLASFMLLACFIVTAIAGRAAPPVAFIKALDLWNFVCLFFLLWALVQSLVVYRMSLGCGSVTDDAATPELQPPKPPAQNGNDNDPEAIVAETLPPPPPPTDDLGPLPPRPRRRTVSPRLLDLVSRVLYLLAFCIVIIVFGVVYS